MRLAELAGRRVAVWGFAREGRAAVALLRRRLPQQRLTLFCHGAEALQAQALGDPGLDIVDTAPDGAALGGYDVIVKSPGISAYLPVVVEARARGAVFTSGTAIWFAEHPGARTLCVTGTKGKSTVTALIAHLLRGAGQRVALAGNIGLPLLELPDANDASVQRWVIELSSFQTRDAAAAPDLLLVNNLYPEHLDWHGDLARYYSDKLALAAGARTLLVNAQQPELLALTADHPRRMLFGTPAGWHVRANTIHRGDAPVFDLALSPLRGAHNAQNLCAALAAIEASGVDARALAPFIASFQPLPHRLQTLGERGGRRFVNDSIATTPYATLEALRSFAGAAVTLLVGGFDRGIGWDDFAVQMRHSPAHAIVTMGANGPRIAAALHGAAVTCTIHQSAALAEAVTAATALTPAGGVVLLSPGAPSFDQFRDYAARGREFARLAGFDPQLISGIVGLGIA